MGRFGGVAMWLILFAALAQNQQFLQLESLNARIFLADGVQEDVVDLRIKGVEPYEFEFRSGGESSFVSLYRITRIAKLKDGKTFEIMFDNGQKQRGQIKSFYFSARGLSELDDEKRYSIYDIERVHLILGSQLKSCQNGDYEEYTPYVYCPICGRALDLGIANEDYLGKPRPTPPFHRLRVDPREQ